MQRRTLILVVIGLAITTSAHAQAPATAWQFHWEKGQTLAYRVEHVTQVAEIVEGNRVATSSKLNLTKRWTVMDVDSNGLATLQLTLTALRNEQTRPGGEILLFDSANPDKTTPELKNMSKFVGGTLATLKVDVQGRVVEAIQGQKARYEVEPPFNIVLPTVVPAQGQAWQRPYDITLDPPAGTGEKFATVQRYDVTKIAGNLTTLKVTTQLKTQPESQRDLMPLLQKLPQGEVVFDTGAGRLISAHLAIDRTLQNHQGEGSSYQFHSVYTEELAE